MLLRFSIRIWVVLLGIAITLFSGFIWAHWPEPPLDARAQATEVVILKAERELILYSGNKPLKTYRVSLGKNPVGQKEKEGDRKTPEGVYVISGHNPKSAFHLSLHISYPTSDQNLLAKRKGVNPGEDIMIHGIKRGFGWLGKFHRFMDWTTGCIAVTNEEIEEIYRSVPDGTKITIKAD